MTDTSTPGQRRHFASLIESGGGGTALRELVNALEHCQLPMGLLTSDLLGLPPNATFAQGAARIRFRWSIGQASH